MPRPVFPSLMLSGTSYPDVPEGAAVLDVPLYAVCTGGALSTTMVGPQGTVGTYGSIRLYDLRNLFGNGTPLRVRVLGCAVGVERIAVAYGAGVATVRWTLVREPLDASGNVVATLPTTDLTPLVVPGLVPGTNAAALGVPIGGPLVVPPAVAAQTNEDRLVSDDAVRFVVTFNDGSSIAAGTLARGRLLLAVWPDVPEAA